MIRGATGFFQNIAGIDQISFINNKPVGLWSCIMK
jgi:hypothetical protein